MRATRAIGRAMFAMTLEEAIVDVIELGKGELVRDELGAGGQWMQVRGWQRLEVLTEVSLCQASNPL